MVWYIAFKDIESFFCSKKKVFIWLMICMICGSFVLNYSYSFARYRGEIYEYNSGASVERYQIEGTSPTESARKILAQINDGDFVGIRDYQLFRRANDEPVIVGSSFISAKSSAFTGIWTEGYYDEIENTGKPVCAVNEKLLDYGEHLKMVDETIDLGEEKFTIKGVFNSLYTDTGVVIFADKFIEKYDEFNSMWITFEQRLSNVQRLELEKIVKENVLNGNLTYPPDPGSVGSDNVIANEIQYTAIMILFLVCLASLITYWQSVNLSAYTVYWINGATENLIMRIAACESFVLCTVTYFVGLGLNAASRSYFSRNSPLTLNDIIVGFSVFFGAFAILTLINTSKICKEFKVANVRRD